MWGNALVDNGADVNQVDSSGWTALLDACVNGHDDVVRLLVDNGADVNVGNDGGITPLMLASENDRNDIVVFLIHHGANVHAKDDEGRTALDYARDDGDVSEILTNGAVILNAALEELVSFVHEHKHRMSDDVYVKMNAFLQRLWRGTARQST